MKNTVILIFSITCFILAQDKTIPTDTSFALFSTNVKVHKDYPDAKLVMPEIPKGVIEKKGLVYASLGKREMHLDLYLPDAAVNQKHCLL